MLSGSMGHLCVQQHIITVKSELVAVEVVVKIRLHKFPDTSIINGSPPIWHTESMVISDLGRWVGIKDVHKEVSVWVENTGLLMECQCLLQESLEYGQSLCFMFYLLCHL